ncbi:hypothetical protein [Halobacterium litoreum]|uniref:C2H2-type domain-containing protein n=1 Tax=Halobacterium litoreum TaxID=2039234 RepID=A0ABD5NFE1_9EURY|nr:hypothetical protein [Halobacterium litoreum]UHH13478.1 hypothetical protein LT972_00435 [Halobacterium litoreum]
MTTKCPTCGEEYERIAQHYAFNEDHRPDLSDDQLDTVRFLLLDGATVETEGAHHSITHYSTDVEFLKAAAARLGDLVTSLRLEATAAEQAEHLAAKYPDMDVTAEQCADLYALRTMPHPRLDAYEGGEDVTELTPNVMTWFIEFHGGYHGSAILPSLHLDTRDTGVSGDHLRRLFHDYGIQTGRLAEGDGETFFVPSAREGVVSLPKKGIDQLRDVFGIDINPAEDQRNHVVA